MDKVSLSVVTFQNVIIMTGSVFDLPIHSCKKYPYSFDLMHGLGPGPGLGLGPS